MDEPYNGLSFDQEILDGHLSMASYPKPMSLEQRLKKQLIEEDSIRKKIREEVALQLINSPARESSRESSREPSREPARESSREPIRETFVVGSSALGGCGCADGFSTQRSYAEGYCNKCDGKCGGKCGGNSIYNDMGELSIFNNSKILVILLFVLSVFCIVQYINQQQMQTEMQNMMSLLQRNMLNDIQSSPQQQQPLSQLSLQQQQQQSSPQQQQPVQPLSQPSQSSSLQPSSLQPSPQP